MSESNFASEYSERIKQQERAKKFKQAAELLKKTRYDYTQQCKVYYVDFENRKLSSVTETGYLTYPGSGRRR